jgi:outer membrane protein assembly factor BamD (BamD/ComL family)
MQKQSFYFLIAAIVLTVFGCKNSNTQSSLLTQIEELQNKEGSIIPEDRKKLNVLYANFADEFPSDSLSPGFLANAVYFNSQVGDLDNTISLGNKFVERYSNSQDLRQVHLTLAQAFLKNDLADSSVLHFEIAQENAPLDNSYLIKLGEAYQMSATKDTSDQRESNLIKAANIKVVTGYIADADTMYLNFCKTYPKSQYAPYAYMRRVEIMEMDGNLDEGKKILEELIATYPESNFAQDAAIILEKNLLGKTDEEKFKMITGE